MDDNEKRIKELEAALADAIGIAREFDRRREREALDKDALVAQAHNIQSALFRLAYDFRQRAAECAAGDRDAADALAEMASALTELRRSVDRMLWLLKVADPVKLSHGKHNS